MYILIDIIKNKILAKSKDKQTLKDAQNYLSKKYNKDINKITKIQFTISI